MKTLKMVGLAVVMALALTAFAGVGSAPADVLCKAAPNASGECSTASGHFEVNQTLLATAKLATFTFTAEEKLTCHAELALTVVATGGLAGVKAEAKIETLRISECKLDTLGTACTVSEGTGYTSTIGATGDVGNGLLTVKSPTTTTITCGLAQCTYTTEENGLTMNVTGGNPAAIVANEALFSFNEGTGCPGLGASPKLDATFNLIKPTNLWVATKLT